MQQLDTGAQSQIKYGGDLYGDVGVVVVVALMVILFITDQHATELERQQQPLPRLHSDIRNKQFEICGCEMLSSDPKVSQGREVYISFSDPPTFYQPVSAACRGLEGASCTIYTRTRLCALLH